MDEFGGFIVVVLLVTGVKQSQLLYLSEEIQNKNGKKSYIEQKGGSGLSQNLSF